MPPRWSHRPLEIDGFTVALQLGSRGRGSASCPTRLPLGATSATGRGSRSPPARSGFPGTSLADAELTTAPEVELAVVLPLNTGPVRIVELTFVTICGPVTSATRESTGIVRPCQVDSSRATRSRYREGLAIPAPRLEDLRRGREASTFLVSRAYRTARRRHDPMLCVHPSLRASAVYGTAYPSARS